MLPDSLFSLHFCGSVYNLHSEFMVENSIAAFNVQYNSRQIELSVGKETGEGDRREEALVAWIKSEPHICTKEVL